MNTIEDQLISIYPDLRKEAFYLTKNNQDADDLAQDVCIDIISNPKGYRYISSFKAYCLTVLKNTFKDNLRRFINRMRASEVQLKDTHGTAVNDIYDKRASDNIKHKELLEKVFEAINTLPDKQRSILLLHAYGSKYKTIADAMGVNIGVVSSSIHRARITLNKLIKYD